jgi:hypothetical protein
MHFKPILIETSFGKVEVNVRLPNSSIYDKEDINGWISNFWWETPDAEKDENVNKDAEPTKTKNCFHDWKEYVGFTEKYWYCEKCDAKSEENPNLPRRF